MALVSESKAQEREWKIRDTADSIRRLGELASDRSLLRDAVKLLERQYRGIPEIIKMGSFGSRKTNRSKVRKSTRS